MITQTFKDKDQQYAFNSIHDFFDSYHLRSAIEETERIIKTAARNKTWKRDYPYRPIHFMEKLQELVTAAYTIGKSYRSSNCGLVMATTATGDPDLSHTTHFVSSGRSNTVWNNMPRHLTASQYHRPWKALKKFTSYMTADEWKQICKDLAEYALSNIPIEDEYPCYRLISIRLHMLRLIEACHLLEVRGNATQPQPKTAKKK